MCVGCGVWASKFFFLLWEPSRGGARRGSGKEQRAPPHSSPAASGLRREEGGGLKFPRLGGKEPPTGNQGVRLRRDVHPEKSFEPFFSHSQRLPTFA